MRWEKGIGALGHGQRDMAVRQYGVAQRQARVEAVLDGEIAAVHLHQRPALADEEGGRVGAVTQQAAVPQEQVEPTLGWLDPHTSGPWAIFGSTWRANRSASAAWG